MSGSLSPISVTYTGERAGAVDGEEQDKSPPKELNLNKEDYYDFLGNPNNDPNMSYDTFYNDVKSQLGLNANVFWLDTIHDQINPWMKNAGNLEDRIIQNTLLKYDGQKKPIPYKLINREEALNYSDKVVIYDASISNSSLLSLSNLIDSAGTPKLSSFLSYNKQDHNKQDHNKQDHIKTANDIQKQFHGNIRTPKLLKTKSTDLSCMTQSDISLFLHIYNNGKYKKHKKRVLIMMTHDADKNRLDEINIYLANIEDWVLPSGVLPNDIKLINIFLLNILWQKTCDYMERCGIGEVTPPVPGAKHQLEEGNNIYFADAIAFLRKFIFTDIVVKGDSYIARFGIKLEVTGGYTMDRNIEFDVTQKACAMALDTKRRNPQSDLCKTTCVGKIFKILEKFENKGEYNTYAGKRKTRNRFVFMLLKFSGDRSHLVLASMYENPSQVCIFTGERPLTSSVLATHLDGGAPNISCVSLGFKAVRDLRDLGIGTAYNGIKDDDFFKTISKRTGEEKHLAYMYYNELTKEDILARINRIKDDLRTIINEAKISECGFDSLKSELDGIGDNAEELNVLPRERIDNQKIKDLQEIKNKYEKLISNVNNPPSKPNKFIWDKFEVCFVPTDNNIDRLNTGTTFTELVVSDLNIFRSKLLDCGYKNRNYGISYTEDTINDKVLNYLDYIHSSLDVYEFFSSEDKKSYLTDEISPVLTEKLTNLKEILNREKIEFKRLINAHLKVIGSQVKLKSEDNTTEGGEFLIDEKLFNAFTTQFNDSEENKTLPKYFNNKEGTPNWKGILLLTDICQMYRTIEALQEKDATSATMVDGDGDAKMGDMRPLEAVDEKFGAYGIDGFFTHDQKTELAKRINPNPEDILFLESVEEDVLKDFEEDEEEDPNLGINVIKDAVYKFFFNLYSFFFDTLDSMDIGGGGDIRCGQRGGDVYSSLVNISKNLYIFLYTNYDNFTSSTANENLEFNRRLTMYDIIEKILFIIHHTEIYVINNILSSKLEYIKKIEKIERRYNSVIEQLSTLFSKAAGIAEKVLEFIDVKVVGIAAQDLKGFIQDLKGFIQKLEQVLENEPLESYIENESERSLKIINDLAKYSYKLIHGYTTSDKTSQPTKDGITRLVNAIEKLKRYTESPRTTKGQRREAWKFHATTTAPAKGGGHRTHKIKRRLAKKTNKKGRQTKKVKKKRKRKSTRKNHK